MRHLLPALLLPMAAFGAWCVFPSFWMKWFCRPVIPQSRDEAGLVLTFDDGPDPRYTPALLDLLAHWQVRAVFFVVAEKAERYPALIQRMQEEGHVVGLHGYAHRNAWFTGWHRSRQDVKRGLSILENMGCVPRWWRPPWGYVNLATLGEMRARRLQLMLWHVMAEDWRADATERTILNKLRKRSRPGSVICLHDAGEGSGGSPGAPLRTIAALSVFLPECLERGWRFVLPETAVERIPQQKGTVL